MHIYSNLRKENGKKHPKHQPERQDQEGNHQRKNQSERRHRNSKRPEKQMGWHVARMEDKRWAKITTEWYPRDCKRARGKPKRKWRDEIEEKVGNNWMRVALDRVTWRQLWRPSASSGVTG